ncbi:MAG: NAD(P)-dependent oxidoreductase [Chloroflexia bacterium]
MAVTEVLIPRKVEEEFPRKTEASAPDVRVVPFDEDGPMGEVGSPRAMLPGGAGTATIRRLLGEYPSIEWVHSFAAGVESLLPEMQGFDVTITNSAGVHGEPIAEWVITMLLAHTKRLPLLLSRQADREWKSELVEEIGGKTLGIVGAGGIGSAITRRAVGLDMQLVGSRWSGRPGAHRQDVHSRPTPRDAW